MADWMPIETARKDGSQILAGGFELVQSPLGWWVYVVVWDDSKEEGGGRWREAYGEQWATFDPQYWQPVPGPP